MNDTCATCKHSQAYHDIPSGCRAWNPDEADNICACGGWKQPASKAAVKAEPAPDHFDWVK